MPAYDWKCHACEAANLANTDVCASCGCPAVASAKEAQCFSPPHSESFIEPAGKNVSNTGLVTRIWSGEIPLPQMFWLYGVAALVAITIVVQFAFVRLAMAGLGGLFFVGLVVTALAAAYQFLVSVGIWRSAGHYTGAKAWGALARVMAGLSLLTLLVGLAQTGYVLTLDTHDSSRSSANAVQSLNRDPTYPLTGFWKGSCTEDFGLLIEPTKEAATYSISFCGPGGCFKPGTYRPNSLIAGDPMYRIVDKDTIEVQASDRFLKYIRCE